MSMSDNKKIKFFQLYNQLPESIRDFLASDKMGIIIDDALNLGKVPSEKFSSIMDLIAEVLFLQLAKEKFRNELEKRINISPIAAQIVDRVIQEKIFKIFEKELSQYKLQPLKQNIFQKEKKERTINPTKFPKIEPSAKERTKQSIPKQVSSEPIIPEYSFPEPFKVVVEKPVSKTEELKKVVAPKVSLEQQEKIREKLLAAMQKKNGQPKIVEEMKKISLKPSAPKETEKKKPPGRIKIGELTSSEILSGKGEKFKDEEVFKKTEKEKPYILGAKLKEEKEKKERPNISKEPIPYKKYQKKNPFGKA